MFPGDRPASDRQKENDVRPKREDPHETPSHMLKLNAQAEIHWRRSNMNKRDPILMKSVEVLKDCRSLNAVDEMNCPMPRSVDEVPVRNEKRCIICINGVTSRSGKKRIC